MPCTRRASGSPSWTKAFQKSRKSSSLPPSMIPSTRSCSSNKHNLFVILKRVYYLTVHWLKWEGEANRLGVAGGYLLQVLKLHRTVNFYCGKLLRIPSKKGVGGDPSEKVGVTGTSRCSGTFKNTLSNCSVVGGWNNTMSAGCSGAYLTIIKLFQN